MPEPLFVEQIKVMAPVGFREAVQDAARQEGRTASEFIREAIRARLRVVEAETPRVEAG